VGSKFVLAAVGVVAVLSALAPLASAEVTFCPSGSGPGQCKDPRGVAVDTETGHVYVADRGNNLVNVFESDGTFLSSFGGGQLSSPTWIAVDNDPASASRHDIYVTTESGDFLVKKFKPTGEYIESESFGEPGTGPCPQLGANQPIAAGPGGNVYVADRFPKGAPGNFASRIIVFDSSGSCLDEINPLPLFESGNDKITSLGVDLSGNLYVTPANGAVVRKYDSSGTPLYELDEGLESEGLAVGEADDVFVHQQRSNLATTEQINFFTQYLPSGLVLRRFGYATGPISGFPSLAAYSSPDGDLFVSGGLPPVRYLALPSPGPVVFPEACKVKAGGLGSVKATLRAEVNPEGKATTFRFQYLTEAKFEAEGNEFKGFSETDLTPLGGAIDFELHEAVLKAEGLTPETKYRCRVVANNADSVTPTVGPEGTFETDEGFKFGPASVSDVGETTATVNVEGNPLGLAAKGEIEYVTDAQFQISRFAEALKAPPGEIEFGAGETMQARSATLSGLAPGTIYRWRLRAKNGNPPEGIVCPRKKPEPCPENEHIFKTYGAPSGPDARRYELVSPGLKNSAEVAVPINAGGFVEDRTIRIQAGASSGEAVTYTSFTSFGQAEGAPGSSQYLSSRTASGWSTENISPFGISTPIAPPFTGFSPDLGLGVVRTFSTPLAPGCQEDFANLYLRDNASGALTCLSTEAPQGQTQGEICFTYAGSSTDGTHAFFAAPVSYPGAGAPAGEGTNLYEWLEGKLRLVSVLPGETPAPPTKKTSFGAGDGNCQTGQATRRHVISADGSKAFWTYVPSNESEPSRLLVRVNGSETVQLDAKESGGGQSGKGVFWAANSDGSIVYFTSENRLVTGSNTVPGEEDLYRYEFDKPIGSRLTNLTTPGSVVGDVRGVSGISDDGSYVYFVAGAVLSAEPNKADQSPEAGKDNLYLLHEGQTAFIATLDPDDEGDWESQPKGLSARVSPDGRHLAFLSLRAQALAGYDNTVANSSITGGPHCRWEQLEKHFVGSPLCAQAFLYGAESKELACVSCNPSGAKPLGPTLLPGWTNVYEGPRYLSDNGSRVFFESYDPLLLADENKKRDVYEFELPGEGTCDSQSPSFSPGAGGCHFLISSGKSGDESYLVDASASGRDAFISTREKLTGWDVNENFDVYDYREGGGFPEPAPGPPICVGEGCKPVPTPQLPPPTPATPAFNGPANPKPHKPKPKKHKHKNKHHKKKNNAKKRGAGR
jgi:hypothetical protein